MAEKLREQYGKTNPAWQNDPRVAPMRASGRAMGRDSLTHETTIDYDIREVAPSRRERRDETPRPQRPPVGGGIPYYGGLSDTHYKQMQAKRRQEQEMAVLNSAAIGGVVDGGSGVCPVGLTSS